MFIITMQIKPILPQSVYQRQIQFVTLIKGLFGIQRDDNVFEWIFFSSLYFIAYYTDLLNIPTKVKVLRKIY